MTWCPMMRSPSPNNWEEYYRVDPLETRDNDMFDNSDELMIDLLSSI
jgi:hypothetical protein